MPNVVARLKHLSELAEQSVTGREWATAAQLRYEPPSDLARRLGNTEPGDGARFKGRGPIQITGRFNYRKFGDLLGVDLCANPALAATPEFAFATAGLFWQSNGLNELADAQRFVDITRRINGGTNGLADRQQYYERAKAVLGVGAIARAMPLERGHEQIVADRARGATAKKRAAPAAKKVAATKKSAAKKSATRPPSSRRAPVGKAAVKKAPVQKAPVKRVPVKKAATKKKAVARNAPTKKAIARKP